MPMPSIMSSKLTMPTESVVRSRRIPLNIEAFTSGVHSAEYAECGTKKKIIGSDSFRIILNATFIIMTLSYVD